MAREQQNSIPFYILSVVVHLLVVAVFVFRFTNVAPLPAVKGGVEPIRAIVFTDQKQIKHWENLLKDPHFLQKEKARELLRKKQARQKKEQERLREKKQKKKKEKSKNIAKNKRIKERKKIEREKQRKTNMLLKKKKAARKKKADAKRKQVAQKKAKADKIRKERRRKKQKEAAVKRKKTAKIKRAETRVAKKIADQQKAEMDAERRGLKNAENSDYSNELAEYISAITAKISGNWSKPHNLPNNSECEIFIKQTRTGLVISHEIRGGTNCGSRFSDSVREAMKVTKKLPPAPRPEVWDSEVKVYFKASEN